MKKRRSVIPKQRTAPAVPSSLSETEQALLSHLQDGYELETDSLGGDPLLRRAHDQEVIRPLSATRNTVKALEERNLIRAAKGSDPLRIAWHLQKTQLTWDWRSSIPVGSGVRPAGWTSFPTSVSTS
jgi:hypothetical protein